MAAIKKKHDVWYVTHKCQGIRVESDVFETLEAAQNAARQWENLYPRHYRSAGKSISPKQWDYMCQKVQELHEAGEMSPVAVIAREFGMPIRSLERKVSKWRKTRGIETPRMKLRRRYKEAQKTREARRTQHENT